MTGYLELIDPVEIRKDTKTINQLKMFEIDHTSPVLLSGWNYELDHVWLSQNFGTGIKKDQTILDVGCGNSPFHTYLEAKGLRDIIGIDRPEGYSHQQVQSNVDYHEDFLKLDVFPNNSVDMIIWLSSIEHNSLIAIQQLVEKSLILLKKGGTLLVTLPIARETTWFRPSEQTNLSIVDCKKLFNLDIVYGDFDYIHNLYRNDVLYLKTKYTQRYGKFDKDDPEFIVGGIKIVKE